MFADESLTAAYRAETDHLTAERVPMALAICLGVIGLSGALEYARWPEHLPTFVAIYAAEVAVAGALLAAQRSLLRRGWLSPANACAWSAIAVLMQVNGGLDRLPSEVSVLAGICLMTGGSLLLPWGVAGQRVLVATSLMAGTVAILLHATTAAPVPYLLFALAAGGAISLFGAYHFELHRFALFVEATRREEEASIGQSLVAIAKEINDALDADDVLDRIAGVIRSALHASWTVIVLCDVSRDACAVVGSAGRAPDGITGLRGVEFASGALPLVDQVLTERHISLTDQDAAPATAGLMLRWQTRALLGEALLRRSTVVGVLLAGTHGLSARFSDRGREISRGIAQHVAIALNNVRLVADLRRANTLKSDFLSMMSHELRTPLNVIMGYADLLRDEVFGPLVEEQQDVMQRLRTNAYSLLDLINATLEVNRIEAGRTGVQLRDVDLRPLLVELQVELDELPRHPGVALRWDLPRPTDVVRTDPMKLKIIVRNLIGNALKFTRRGHVTVQAGVDLRARALEIVVRDTGPGIESEHLPKIFDMFHQAPSDANPGGVGLGLYIVRRFAELLGGRISATSTVGEGATFRLSLPAGVAAQPVSIEEHRRRRSA